MPTTYLHPKAQRYTITMRNFSYNMRAKDIVCIQGASLIIHGYFTFPGTVVGTPEDISSKLSMFLPAIGTTQASVGMDYIRLATSSWIGTPSPPVGDGYVDFSTNSSARMQHLKTSFTPPANLTSYHLAYYSASTSSATFPTKVDVGTSNGIGLTLGMNGASGTLGNIYNTTNAVCLPKEQATGNPLSTQNIFLISRTNNTQEHFYYGIDTNLTFAPDEFNDSPVASSTTAFAPGFIVIGADLAAPGVTYTTRNCEGASVGTGLTLNQASILMSAFYYIHTNK